MAVQKQPPVTQGLRWLGNALDFKRDPMAFLTSTRQYGDVVLLNLPLPIPLFMLTTAEGVEQMIITNNKLFPKPQSGNNANSAATMLLGNGLVLSNGDFWLRQRRLAQPAFHRHRVAVSGDTMVQYAKEMVAGWHDGQTLNIHEEMTELTLRIVVKTLFGLELTADVRRVNDAFQVLLNAYSVELTAVVRPPEWLPSQRKQRLKQAVATLDGFIYKLIAERRKHLTDTGDLLSMLLLAEDEDGSQMSDQQLRDEVTTLFFAGHETTALALSWAFYLLARHPEVETGLHGELDRVLGHRSPTVADVQNLTYTNAIVAESLRLYPPAWLSGRVATQDSELMGYSIPEGSNVLYSEWVLHRDPRYFEEPDRFKPDRWLGDLAKRLPRCAYIPFNAGPRVCIGNQFALMEAALIMAEVNRNYWLRLVPGQTVMPEPSLTMRPKYGVQVTLERR